MPKTALDLTPEEWKAYRIPKRVETPELKKRKEDAWKVAREATALLKDKFGVKKIALFGSLARGYGFTKWSDIDLAIDLFDSDQYFRAIDAVSDLSSEFKIDLIELSLCREKFCRTIKQEWVEL